MSQEPTVRRKGAALLGRVALYCGVLAIPGWVGAGYALFLQEPTSSGAPFLFGMFFFTAILLSPLAVVIGYTASFFMRDESDRKSRTISLIGARIGLAAICAAPMTVAIKALLR